MGIIDLEDDPPMMSGAIAGFVRTRYGLAPLISDRYNHIDVTMLGIMSLGGITRTRPSVGSVQPQNFTLVGIRNALVSSTMPTSRTSFNGGFCIFYEFEATRALTEFEGNTLVQIRAAKESAILREEAGIFFSSQRVTGWRSDSVAIINAPAVIIPRSNNAEEIITSITGQRSIMDALQDGVTSLITEGTVVEAIRTYAEYFNTIISPNGRTMLISIVMIDL